MAGLRGADAAAVWRDDSIKRFRTSVALANLKTGLRVPLDIVKPAA